ncbi:MAG: hypothetical protein J6K21_03635 [Bacilli bacterium]|nr:hypothetical protein [Bacilli bacterium]
MIKQIYKDIYQFTDKLYDKYNINDKKILNYILSLEDSIYDSIFNKLSLNKFNEFLEYVEEEYDKINQNEDDNYEVLLYGDKKAFIIRRIYNKLSDKLLCDYSNEKMTSVTLNDQIILESNFIENAMIELAEKIIANIEIKFLYLMQLEKIPNNKEYIKNLSFISSYLEEKIKENNDIKQLVKSEDNLYDNLWEDFKSDYEYMLNNYVIEAIEKDIVIMHSYRDLNNSINSKIRSLYLRTMFNFLDEDEIEQINYSFREKELKIYNKVGYDEVINAFKKYNEDQDNITKIKTH